MTTTGERTTAELGTQAKPLDALVIGAGFAGIYALHKLRNELGMCVQLLEAGTSVGGTWHWNRYPGARCDSDGFVYCYSFDKELLQEWRWQGKYPRQEELQQYFQHVAEKHDLLRSITFETFVKAAHWLDDEELWKITTGTGRTIHARYLVSGIGTLSIAPHTPKFPGLQDFAGEWYHTANWPEEDVDLTGKRVGIIGTGSSGVQAIPELAERAAHLTVFQRTPQYSIPARHETVDEQFWEDVRANYDEIWDAAKKSAGGFPWQHNGQSALDVSEEERTKTFETLWREGGIKFALGSYRDIALNLDANQTVSDFIRAKIRETVNDPETAEKLIPEFPFWARRPIVDTNYFETYNRDDVTLLDVKADPIVAIESNGVRLESGQLAEVDVLVLATGFDAISGPFAQIDFRGRKGLRLSDKWEEGLSTYLGLQTSDFPNLFMITGPGSTTGNLPLTIETHVDWISDCIQFLESSEHTTIEPSAPAEAKWTEFVQEQAENSMLRYADSWINGSNIPGKRRQYLFFLGHFGKYRTLLSDVAARGYDGFTFDKSGSEDPEQSETVPAAAFAGGDA